MRVPCIQSVWFAREKGKEKNPHALLEILSSLFPSNLEGKEKCWPYGELSIFLSLISFLSKHIY